MYAEIPCDSGYNFSSIIRNGKAEIVEDSAEKCYSLGRIFEHQTGRKVDFTEKLVLIEKYGLPQEWNEDGKYGPERYIEAHIWCDDAIDKYLRKESSV